jgi:hypothetical protein
VQATLNLPLATDSRIWTDSDARAELQLGGSTVRQHSSTAVYAIRTDAADANANDAKPVPDNSAKTNVVRATAVEAEVAKEEPVKGEHLRASIVKPEAWKPPAARAVQAVPPESEAELLLRKERRKKLEPQRRWP